MILIVDFGSQTTHLIGRRIREMGVEVQIIPAGHRFKLSPEFVTEKGVKGIILSGGPASVYERNAPTVDREIFERNIPILGICYGQQLIGYLLGGKVKPGKIKEYGPAFIRLKPAAVGKRTFLFAGLPEKFTVWMSHGDKVTVLPKGFELIAQSESVKSAAIADERRQIYGVQFHPEVEHTKYGELILRNFLEKICKVKTKETKIDIGDLVEKIKEKIGQKRAIAAVSGGLDSTVAATLAAMAIGDKLIPIHIENGLMRKGTAKKVEDFFTQKLSIKPIILHKKEKFLQGLKGKFNPEEKRKTIGKLYIDLFEEEIKKHQEVEFLVQGTIYSDVIESSGTKHADNIKSHHNVGGLPENLKLTLVEPLRFLYTDQVKKIARKIGIPEKIITQQPHPGPGYAIRIIGEVTKKRLEMIQKCDEIVVDEIKKANLYEKLLHSFPILTGAKSTAVKGDARIFGEVVAIRAVSSSDRMTADWARLPYDLLQKIAGRIVNEIPEISRAVYDITTKPPATMEWE